ncbi:MAG: 50S ribosomal protein L23 [Deltaproteobacteria bacterium]|nr:50S ribosomal protein L23 [Deltaproteobacteria bacterium]
MKTIYDILLRPLITEKSNMVKDALNKVSFIVRPDANKTQIKDAVEALFKVKVAGVQTAVIRGKMKRMGRHLGKRPNYKKAVVTLKKGYAIDFMGGA